MHVSLRIISVSLSAVFAVVALGLTGSAALADHNLTCHPLPPSRTGPIADVLYSAAGNSAGVYEGGDRLRFQLFRDSRRGLTAYGTLRDTGSGLFLVADGPASAQCSQASGGELTLVQLTIDLRNARTGEIVRAVITPTGSTDDRGRHLATISVGYQVQVGWYEVAFQPIRQR